MKNIIDAVLLWFLLKMTKKQVAQLFPLTLPHSFFNSSELSRPESAPIHCVEILNPEGIQGSERFIHFAGGGWIKAEGVLSLIGWDGYNPIVEYIPPPSSEVKGFNMLPEGAIFYFPYYWWDDVKKMRMDESIEFVRRHQREELRQRIISLLRARKHK